MRQIYEKHEIGCIKSHFQYQFCTVCTHAPDIHTENNTNNNIKYKESVKSHSTLRHFSFWCIHLPYWCHSWALNTNIWYFRCCCCVFYELQTVLFKSQNTKTKTKTFRAHFHCWFSVAIAAFETMCLWYICFYICFVIFWFGFYDTKDV